MTAQPEFPKLILKALALNQGPGRRFIQQLLERGRTRGARKVSDLKDQGQIASSIDPDILRLAFVSLAMMPILLKDIFEEQMARPMDVRISGQVGRIQWAPFLSGFGTGNIESGKVYLCHIN